MRIVNLPDGPTVIVCIVMWLIFQLGAAWGCLYAPDRCFDPGRFWFRIRPFEQGGQWYRRYLKVHRWKHLLPDGAALAPTRGYRKRHLAGTDRATLERFSLESCRGEMSHVLAIAPFWIFGFILPPHGILIMLIYALAVNLPCIVVQRYNRARIEKILSAP